jgi:DNA replication protein DnaC
VAINCWECRDLGYLRNDVPFGHALFGQLTPCPHCKAPELTRRLQDAVLPAGGLLPRERGITLENLTLRGEGSRQLMEETRRMLERPFGMLTVWGGPGNGKTLALQVLVNAWLTREQSAVYLRLADLLEFLRAGYDPDSSLKLSARYQSLATVGLLAIDEFDKARITDWGREWLFTLMDDRYRFGRERGADRRHTVLAMNDDPETLPVYLLSRLRFDLDGPDGFRIVHNVDWDARPIGI